MDEELDFSKLKYVLYARKSTTDETRQVRSIPDQIHDCELLANRIGIKVIKILEETKSAKKPHQRPIFTQMLKDIRQGVYDGILAWNPDRLARNMLEAGMLIDMVDTGVIKDLKFVTHTYSPDANGKMLLGMSFVLSKQYSDDLSQKVTRGVRRNLAEGKTPTPKHGYINENKIYRPDGKHFELMCEAWQMRVNGESLKGIADYMNRSGYFKLVKRKERKIKMTPQILSDIFRDPFYCGILIQKDKKVDLREAYDFVPAVSEEDYNLVQQLTYHKAKPQKPHRLAFYPLRQMVKCAFCDHYCQVGPSSGRRKRYLYYRCDNQYCDRPKRSIRAKVIFDYIYRFLESGLNFTEKEYQQYSDGLDKITGVNRRKMSIQLHSMEGSLKSLKQDIRERSLGIVKFSKGSRIAKENNDEINKLAVQEESLTKDIIDLRAKLATPEQDKLSMEQFLNLSDNAAAIVQAGNPVVKDIICREIFLNLIVDEENVLSHQLKEPFATLLKQRKILSSRGDKN